MKFSSLSLVSCLLTFLASPAFAEDWGFGYSGRLLEKTDGESEIAKVDGSTSYYTNFYVRLYADSDGQSTNAVWSKLITRVPVLNGNFAFEVAGRDDSGVTIPEAFAAFSRSHESRLTIGVTPFDRNHTEIAPRQDLVAVPYAVFASDALGTFGDASFTGTVTAAAASTPAATFKGSVNHVGSATFNEDITLGRLALPDGKDFSAGELVASNVLKAATIKAGQLSATTAEATVADATSLAVEGDLAVAGNVHAQTIVPNAGMEVAISNDVTANEITAAEIEVGESVNLFDFKSYIETVGYRKDGPAAGGWGPDGNSCSWTPQGTHNSFVSLSLLVQPENTVVVSVGDTKVATLGVAGVSGAVWLPFQTFLKPGEKLSWTGEKWTGDQVHLVYREVGF